MALANIQSSLNQGIFRDLQETWRNKFPIFEKQNALFSRKLPDTTVRSAKYAWKESIPFPSKWDYTRGRTHKGFRDRDITVSVFPYENTIDVLGRDREHDQLGDTKTHINLSTTRFLQIPQKLFAEYLNGTANLNPSLVNAYDGVSIYSTVDGAGDARFGATNGNILTSSGLGVADLQNDLFRAQEQFLAYLDTANEILYSPEDVDFLKFHVVVPRQLNEVAARVAEVEYLRSDPTNNTSEGNFFKGKFNLHINNLLTDSSDWYIFLEHEYWKTFVHRQNSSVRAIWADMSNSDRAREYNVESIYADQEIGIGLWAPFTTIKINT